MSCPLGRRIAAAFALSCLPALALAQSGAAAPPQAGPFGSAGAASERLPELVVTATGTEQPLTSVGSTISVISSEQIERSTQSPNRSVDDLFRQVPGLQVTQSGGAGSVQTVRIRGADVRHTLVLVDGIRVNDPTTTGREFDFSNLVLTNVDRIEVLRGPQSALYGSDAMGGVINIITKRGDGAPRVSLSTEAGRYGTSETQGSVSGGDGIVDYALGFDALETAGFSAYGYRIRRLRYQAPVAGFEPDAALRYGVNGRFGINLGDGVRLEIGASTSTNRFQYDAAFYDPAFAPAPDTASKGETRLANVYARLSADTLGGLLTNKLTVFANRTERSTRDNSFGTDGVFCNNTFVAGTGLTPCIATTRFVGDRLGTDYQGDLKLGPIGLLTFGGRIEREQADSFAGAFTPVTPRQRTIAAEQTTRSVFLQHQVTIGERLHITLGGRIDDVISPDRLYTGLQGGGSRRIDQFSTVRLAAAYDIPETGTKLRASVGTGARTPSLYQLFDPTYGTPNLQAEHSVGLDAGIDQSLFDDRVKLSATVFENRLRNLVDFSFAPTYCGPAQFFGCYFNIAAARTAGVELEGTVKLLPDWVSLRLTYTHLDARDLATEFKLARRPEDQGRIGFIVTPIPKLSIEPAIVLVGPRFSSPGQTDRLPSYARLDVYADYKLDETYSVYARGENLTDTRYQEVKNYGTAGASLYGGIRARW